MRINQIKNPSFETDLTGYTSQSLTTRTRDTTEFLYGTASLKCVVTGATRCAVYGATGAAAANADSIPLASGTYASASGTHRAMVTFSCYVKETTTAFAVRARIHWFNAAGAWISDSDQTLTTPTINVWTRFSVTGQPPSSAASYGVVLYSNGTGTLYTDGWLAEESPIADVYFDGDTTDAAYTHAWSGPVHASTSTAVASGVRTNLVPNPSLETNASSWTASGTINRGTGWPYMYAGAVYMSSVDWAFSAKQPATAGLPYTGSAYLNRGGGARNAAVSVRFYSVADVELEPPTVTQTAILTQSEHQRFASRRIAPTGTAHVALRLDAGTLLSADAFLLEQSEYLDSYFDGDTKATTTTQAWTGAAHASTSTQTAGAPADGTLVTVKHYEAGAWVSRPAVPRACVAGVWTLGNPKRWDGSAWIAVN